MRLWGRDYTREALLRRVGRLEQVGGVEAAVLDDGPDRGVRALRFTGAAGLSCTVLPDRGMDISALTWHGTPLSWSGSVGRPAPGLAMGNEESFARSFFGGMLTTCGLTNFGPGGEEGGEHLSMHGLATYLPAAQVAWGERWEDDRCILFARGTIRQARLFGENLTLSREISMDLDGDTLTVEDVVRNEGWESTPHMILYHCNIGFPLLDDGAQLHGRFASITPRDEEAKRVLQALFGMKGAPEVGQHVIVLDDYDLAVAAHLVQGCDVWLNLPRPPLEASGTSGMKSVMNGGLQLSVLDGWWAEGYDGSNGWALSGEVDDDHAAQDARHANELFRVLEEEVVPAFYERDGGGVPQAWVQRMRASLRTLGPEFSATRMLGEYVDDVYLPRAAVHR